MTIKPIAQLKRKKIEIDLTGPNGNAYYLMALAGSLAKQLDLHPEAIIDDMKSGDYEHLLEVFDAHFGDFVTLYR